MDLKQRISSLPPSDNSGPRVSNRFDFQKDWAICKLLELHTSGCDYLLTFEHHDDIIIFNSSDNPTKVSFHQVKTADKAHWTLTHLLKTSKGKKGTKHSYLGKLYEHLAHFNDDVENLFFVTNCKLDSKLKDGASCYSLLLVKCADLCDENKLEIEHRLKAEYGVGDLKNFLALLSFRLNELSILDHTTLTKGKLSTFLDEQFPDLQYQITPLYRAIFDEVKMKTDFEPAIRNFDTLKTFKSITRQDFEKHLNTIKDTFSIIDSTTAIENRLNSEMVSVLEVSLFKRNAARYRIQKMSYNDRTLNLLTETIGKSINRNQSSLGAKLYENMLLIFDNVKSFSSIEMDASYIKCIILFQIYEGQF